MTVHVLFVCLGNICRSPTAHGLFQNKVDQAGLSNHISVDSAGTGGWHAGNAPDERAQSTAHERGYDISDLKARQVVLSDFDKFDFILAMDKDNLNHLLSLKPKNYKGTVGLFLDVIDTNKNQEVPDPYYGGQAQFDLAIQLIDDASEALLQKIRQQYDL